ncbi:MAG TPA: condensation domain-containing protein, partial [Candidatus Angelobacter sp.]
VFADVLGAERVGIHDNFFDLGGHSLLAAKLVSRVRAALGKEVSIRMLFESPTVADLVEKLSKEALNPDRLSKAQTVRPALVAMTRPERMPLSYAQQRLWFLYQMEGPGATYNIPLALRLEGQLNEAALEQALGNVVERHEALRTVFPQEEGVPYQKVLTGEEAKPQLRIESFSESELKQRLTEAASVGMELEWELPLRPWLFRLSENKHVLLLVLHHIAGDGWSLGPLARDLEDAYPARIEGKTPEWDPLPVQYGDYTLWQRELLGSESDPESAISRQLEFWKKALEGMPEELALPTDRPRPAVMSYRGGTVPLELDAELHRGLLGLARRSGASLFMVLQAGVAALLSRLGAGEDIPIGTVVAGRSEAELEELVGFFVNTLVLRTDLSGDPTFTALIERVRRFALEAYSHQEVPFERLVEAVQPERSQSRHPLFQVALTLENTPNTHLNLPLLSTHVEVSESNVAKFDLGFGLSEFRSPAGDPLGIHGDISYNNDLFDEMTVRSLSTRLVRMLKEMVQAPDTRLHRAEILSIEEKHILLETFNATAQEVPEATVSEMFEKQVAHSPEATALAQGEISLTYVELNQQANRLAHYLIARGIGPESLVGIALEPSPEMVVAILAAWKSGAAYLPLDPEYPPARLDHMLTDARPRIVLTTVKRQEKLRHNSATEVICLDAANIQTELMLSPAHNPLQAERTIPVLPHHPAYLIYTSGSTGVPKGVLVTHVGIPSLARSHVQNLKLGQRSRVLQFASLNFDASFWELAMALTTGAALVLLKDERGGIPLQEILHSQRITHATLTPSVLATLDERQESDIETLIVVGEQCPRELVACWSRGRHMINAYGPTEITVCATMSLPLSGSVIPPIGFPVINTRTYVLDGSLEPVPVGVAGELYIAGAGLAR